VYEQAKLELVPDIEDALWEWIQLIYKSSLLLCIFGKRATENAV